jgi:hypothetical protein
VVGVAGQSAGTSTPSGGVVMTQHPEVVRECGEDGKGWRIDEKGDWFPCGPLGPLLTREEYREKKAAEGSETEESS